MKPDISVQQQKQIMKRKRNVGLLKMYAYFQNEYGIILKLQNNSYFPRIKGMIH
jgi:hypothetical protein